METRTGSTGGSKLSHGTGSPRRSRCSADGHAAAGAAGATRKSRGSRGCPGGWSWPSSVFIGGHDILLEPVSPGSMRVDGISACCLADENKILFHAELPFSRQVEVFFHEVYHLAVHRIPGEVKEEGSAVRTGEIMVDFLRNNPDVIHGMVDELCKDD